MERTINKRNWKSIIKPFFKIYNPVFFKGNARSWTYTPRLKEVLDKYIIDEDLIRRIAEQNEIKINVEQGISDLKQITEFIMEVSAGITKYNETFKPKFDITSVQELRA